MNEWIEDFKTYLPKYLSTDAQTKLFVELSQFPSNIDSRLYTLQLSEERTIFQGDGLASLWVADLPTERIGKTRVMVLSNTCDLAPDNKYLMGPRLLYCPIVSVSRFAALLRASCNLAVGFDIESYLKTVRQQEISSMFYLPKNDLLGEEAIALLDRINNCDAQAAGLEELLNNRLFTLSDYGFYLFLFKLSLHLTRIREGVARN